MHLVLNLNLAEKNQCANMTCAHESKKKNLYLRVWFRILHISTMFRDCIYCFNIALDLDVTLAIWLGCLSSTLSSTQLKSPPIIIFDSEILGISLNTFWKKRGSSWFGAYKLTKVICFEFIDPNTIIYLPFISDIVFWWTNGTFLRIKIATPLALVENVYSHFPSSDAFLE